MSRHVETIRALRREAQELRLWAASRPAESRHFPLNAADRLDAEATRMEQLLQGSATYAQEALGHAMQGMQMAGATGCGERS